MPILARDSYQTLLRLLVMMVLLLVAPTLAQNTAPQTPEVPEPDPSVAPLLEDFRNLFTSLRNSGGVREAHLPVLQRFRERINVAIEQRPSDLHLLAMDVQLSEWLKEDVRVDEGYRRLVAASPGESRYVDGWINYFRRQEDEAKVAAIYQQLMELNPQDTKIAVDFAQYLRRSGQYAAALARLEQADIDPDEFPDMVFMQAECLMAQERFDEVVPQLDRVPTEALDSNPALSAQVALLRNQAEEVAELWALEQELRAAEAAADDLPRANLVTDRGLIVVELLENEAPNTVANFISLADDQFYDGTKFFGVIGGTSIQAGDPITREGNPGSDRNPGYRIADEHQNEGARNHFSGSLAMVSGPRPDTGGCLFLITHRPLPERNGRYTVFGRVIEGLDVVRSLQLNDRIDRVEIVRRRDHDYEVETLPLALPPTPTTPEAAPTPPPATAPAG